MNSNLDVWAIQTLPEELITALDNIKTDNDLILYTNLACSFKIGNENIISRQFDTFLYSEENDILVMLMRGGKATADDIRKYLDNKNFKYNEIRFLPSIEEYEDDYSIPELWFARELYVVEDAINDSIERNSKKECEYYPFLTGNLDLSYLTNRTSENCKVEGRIFRGLIKLEDKIILIINQNDHRNVTSEQVYEIMKKYGIECRIMSDDEFTLDCIENKKNLR